MSGVAVFDGAADVEIGRAGIVGVDATLQADLGRAALPGLDAAALDFVERQVVRPAAQVGGQPAFGEGAELAAEIADIGVVDVAIDDIGDAVAVDLASQRIGCRTHAFEIVTACREQCDDVAFGKRLAGRCPRKRVAQLLVDRGSGFSLGAERGRGRNRFAGTCDPVVRAREAFRVAGAQHLRTQRCIEPLLRLGDVGGIDREPLHQHLARFGRALRQGIECRPRLFWVDVVGRHRRHAAPVVDAGARSWRTADRRKGSVAPGCSCRRRRRCAPSQSSTDDRPQSGSARLRHAGVRPWRRNSAR